MLVIPAIDLLGGRCSRLWKGDFSRATFYPRNPVDLAVAFQEAGFPRLHLIDLDGARDGGKQNQPVIRDILQAVRIPVQVGGGIRQERHAERLLDWGASQVIVGTVALQDADLLEQWIHRWGAQPFIVSLDFRGRHLQSHGWKKSSPMPWEAICGKLRQWGISRVIITDVELDGTLARPNAGLCRQILQAIPEIGVIAAGGLREPKDLRPLKKMGLEGAVVGRALYEGGLDWRSWLEFG